MVVDDNGSRQSNENNSTDEEHYGDEIIARNTIRERKMMKAIMEVKMMIIINS